MTAPRASAPPVRRLRVDLDTPIARHWCGGDPFLTAFFNALSMSFPFGEQFFIDAVRAGAQRLTADQARHFEAAVQGFVGQEATHRHVHSRFNRHLHTQGLVNDWERRGQARQRQLQGVDVRHLLAITAAHEHFTALFADWLLAHPQVFGDTEARLQHLWQWHSAEELEHRSTAFDLYRALGGSEVWRRRWMRRVTVFFLWDLLHQTALNLRHDHSLWRWRTWRSAWTHLLAPGGLLRDSLGGWRRYFHAGFHPEQGDGQRSADWLATHDLLFKPVSPGA